MDLLGSQEVFSSGENLKIYRSKFRGLSLVNTGQNTATFSWNLDRGAYFEGCVFSPGYVDGVGWVRPTKFRVRDTSAAGRETTFNNCVLDGYWNHIFDVEHTTATLNLNNTILGSYNWGIGATRASPVYFTLAGTVNAVNVQRLCYWKGQEFSLASGAAGTLNETNTITNQGLGFVEHNTALGGLAFTVDDGDTDNMQYVADLLASLDASAGEVFTWFPDQRSIAGTPPAGYSTYQELYQAVVAAGHEIGCAGLTGGALDGLSESAFKVDVTAAKTWIEETVGGGYEVKTFSWPGGATNSNMQGWLQELGFIGARTSAATQSTLNSVNLFEIETWAQPSENAIFSPSTTEANMLNQGVATAQGSRGHGTISTVLSHNATELPVAVATPFLQGAARTGYLKTFGALVQEYLDNSNTTTVDGVNYTNIMADYGDYSLQSDAYGIGTGAKYWSGPEPVGLDGEPFSDIDTDIGIIQSTASPFHPVNL